MSVLEELFYGDSIPNNCEPQTAESEKYETQLAQSKKKLIATLSEEQRDIFSDIEDAYTNIQTCYQCCSFIEGYKLAVRSMIESLK